MARNYPKEQSGARITSDYAASDPMVLDPIDRRIEQLTKAQTEATADYNIKGQLLLSMTGLTSYHDAKRHVGRMLRAQELNASGYSLADAERDALTIFMQVPFSLVEGQKAAEAFQMADVKLSEVTMELNKEMDICKHLETHYGRLKQPVQADSKCACGPICKMGGGNV